MSLKGMLSSVSGIRELQNASTPEDDEVMDENKSIPRYVLEKVFGNLVSAKLWILTAWFWFSWYILNFHTEHFNFVSWAENTSVVICIVSVLRDGSRIVKSNNRHRYRDRDYGQGDFTTFDPQSSYDEVDSLPKTGGFGPADDEER